MKLSENQALSKLAAYCSKAERAEMDIRRKLIGWELTEEEIKHVISRLKKENFLNEERYCRSFVKDKIRFNKWGKNKIVFELRKKKIPESVIDSCFAEMDNDEFSTPLLKLLTTKSKSIKASNDYDKQMKLIRFALGRGYTLDQIKKCLKELDLENDEHFE